MTECGHCTDSLAGEWSAPRRADGDSALRRRGRLATQIRSAMPVVFDAAHQEGTVELNRAAREERLVVEETGPHLMHLERFNAPVDPMQYALWPGAFAEH